MVSHKLTSGGLAQRYLYGRRARYGRGRGLVMLAGWTGTVDYWAGEQAGQAGGEAISIPTADFAEDGSHGLLTNSCSVDSTWGNSTMRTRLTTLVDDSQTQGYFPNGRVNLYGNSMGALCCLTWALENPTRVASIALTLTPPDLQSMYDRDPLSAGIQASISSAYGGRPDDDENPINRLDELARFPIKIWYSTDDTVTPLAETQEFIEGTGCEAVSMGAVQHTWGDKSVFNGTELARWAHAYGSG